MSEANKFLSDSRFEGEVLDFSKRTQLQGGTRCVFRNCELRLDPRGLAAFRGGERIVFTDCQFENCRFVALSQVRGLDLSGGQRLVGCSFEGGPFTEAFFGPGKFGNFGGEVRQCDFSGALLRDAMFFGTDIEELRLPAWPHVVAVARDANGVYAAPSADMPALSVLVGQVKSWNWPDIPTRIAVQTLVFALGLAPTAASIVVVHADALAKTGECTPDEIRAALDAFACPAIRY